MRVLQALLLICATALTVRAQATLGSATIGGTIRDASGAAVPEAKVVLTETARGLSRETTANSAGSFLFPSVAPGVYFLRVTKEAFDAYELKGIQVEVGQLATLDVSLKVGPDIDSRLGFGREGDSATRSTVSPHAAAGWANRR